MAACFALPGCQRRVSSLSQKYNDVFGFRACVRRRAHAGVVKSLLECLRRNVVKSRTVLIQEVFPDRGIPDFRVIMHSQQHDVPL